MKCIPMKYIPMKYIPMKYKWKRRPRPSFPFLRQASQVASLPGTYYREELNSLETAPRAVDSGSPSGPIEAFAS